MKERVHNMFGFHDVISIKVWEPVDTVSKEGRKYQVQDIDICQSNNVKTTITLFTRDNEFHSSVD